MPDRPPAPAGAAAPWPGTVVIRGGTVVDETGTRQADVLVRDGRVVAVEKRITIPGGATVLDAGGCLVAPGLVDLHAHLRQPGAEEAETVESGSRAAVLGGFTAVVAMPNTDPPVDSAAVALEVLALGAAALCRVAVAGAITVGRAGERLAPMGELAALGVRLFTDDGAGVQDGGLMRRALDYARGLGVTLAQHCEDRAIAAGGLMHEGEWSARLGLPGVPAAAEEAMVARDIALVAATGAPMHFLHLSCAGSLSLVAAARAAGMPVTAEVAPHHLALTDAELAAYDPLFKVNPPLRSAGDVAAVRRACATGTVDAVATDHAPHAAHTKEAPLDEAPSGMLGLQTAWPVALAALHRGDPGLGADGETVPALSVADVIGLLSWRPARIAGLDRASGGDQGGPVVAGAPANLCVLDPAHAWTVEARALASRSGNSPWRGRTLTGSVRHTVVAGEPVVIGGEAQR